MACKYYNSCEYCEKKNDCPYDLMGDGSASCPEFLCTVPNCERSFCVDAEDEI